VLAQKVLHQPLVKIKSSVLQILERCRQINETSFGSIGQHSKCSNHPQIPPLCLSPSGSIIHDQRISAQNLSQCNRFTLARIKASQSGIFPSAT
jgi:hypothetical protein